MKKLYVYWKLHVADRPGFNREGRSVVEIRESNFDDPITSVCEHIANEISPSVPWPIYDGNRQVEDKINWLTKRIIIMYACNLKEFLPDE